MLKRSILVASLAAILALPVGSFAQTKPTVTVEPAPKVDPFVPQVIPQTIEGGYAVVISKATQDDEAWAKVVDTLTTKYGKQVKVFVWEKSVDETKAGLSEMMPRYTCFVTRPKEASREFVGQVHRLTRNLNDDPYPDTIWGILTGLTADDALRMAQTSAPLEIHNVVSTTGVHSEWYDSVFTVSDGKEGQIFQKGDSAKSVHPNVEKEGDRAEAVVDAIHSVKPDMFVTSSHAGESVLEMPWSHGVFTGKNGEVIARSTSGGHGHLQLDDHGWELASPNPKVWVAAGNCLIGHINSRNSMALAMMHSAGVTQMVGYTVTTWYGAGGWGTLGWFQDQPGKYTLAESFFINDAAITHRLAKEFPGHERFAVKEYNDDHPEELIQEMGQPYPTDQKTAKDLVGLTWDHDVVAFYGDPAWSARVAQHDNTFTQHVINDKTSITVEVTATADGAVKAFAFLPLKIKSADYQTSGDAKDTLLTDGYVLADFGSMKAGEKKQAVFTTK